MHKISSLALWSVIKPEKNNNGARFTIQSNRTGKDYTYKIVRNFFKNSWYTHIYVETEYLQFVRLGTYMNGKIINKGRVVESNSAVAISWVLQNIEDEKFEFTDNLVTVMHLGCCLRCGKTLTDAGSIQIGLGPVCRSL